MLFCADMYKHKETDCLFEKEIHSHSSWHTQKQRDTLALCMMSFWQIWMNLHVFIWNSSFNLLVWVWVRFTSRIGCNPPHCVSLVKQISTIQAFLLFRRSSLPLNRWSLSDWINSQANWISKTRLWIFMMDLFIYVISMWVRARHARCRLSLVMLDGVCQTNSLQNESSWGDE